MAQGRGSEMGAWTAPGPAWADRCSGGRGPFSGGGLKNGLRRQGWAEGLPLNKWSRDNGIREGNMEEKRKSGSDGGRSIHVSSSVYKSDAKAAL